MISKIVTAKDVFIENVIQDAGGQSFQKFINLYS